ncbi:hypothetical protein ACLOJK_002737 [Asimina triloba]
MERGRGGRDGVHGESEAHHSDGGAAVGIFGRVTAHKGSPDTRDEPNIIRRRKPTAAALGLKNFSLIFITSLVGISVNQNCYFMGMYHTSSSIATAMTNLLPAITFVIAAALGLEKVNLRSMHSIAKIIGTIASVLGAIAIALIKGTKLLNMQSITLPSIIQSVGENWVLGCSLLLVRSTSWSLWLILQVPMSESYPDHLSLSTWMCFLASIQSGVIAIIFEPNLESWKFHSSIMISCCVYSGTIGSGVAYFVQSWCISRRGPVFSAMFSPLCTVIVTITACIVLNEELYMGSLIGAIVVVAGLYAVLWGQAHELETQGEVRTINENSLTKSSSDEASKDLKIEIKQPLLGAKLYDSEQNGTTRC